MRRRLHWIVLAALYGAFWLWYGGSGTPLSAEGSEALISQMEARAAERGGADHGLFESFRDLVRDDDGNEFYMLNLMLYRDKAVYPPGSGYDDDVKAAANRYSAAVLPALLRHGSHPILVGNQVGSFLSPAGAQVWDQVGIVRYRSRRDMLEMALDLGSRGGGEHKWASIEKTHVFPVAPIIDLIFVRWTIAVLFVALGAALQFILRPRAG